ncbi:MAG TPA: hypothetical protein VHO07_22410 [Streptosporangiaceae bacterium]|nr:hypothetical protein [Streptosporangiaceae bacterium]
MSAWLSKWAPASGVLAGVLVAIAFFASPNSPGDNATGAQVIAWYGSHHTSDFVFDLIGGLALLFLVLFAVALARQVRTGDRWLAHGALAGAVFGGVGFLTSVGFDTVLAQDHNRLTVASAQTLNLLENDFFLPILIGFALFGILTGLAVVVGRILPKWMGWVMFVFGLACLAGPAGFFGVLATVLWVLVAGIWMVKQGPPVPDRATLLAQDGVTV